MSNEAIAGLHSGPLVLVVDAAPINRFIVPMQLGHIGCRVQVVESECAALEVVATQPIDLFLMDCQMPGMDGFTTASRIRQDLAPGRPLAIIALTARDQAGDLSRSQAAGMDDYLVKPLQFDSLKAAITRWTSQPLAQLNNHPSEPELMVRSVHWRRSLGGSFP